MTSNEPTPGRFAAPGDNFAVHVTLDVDDATAQAATLGLPQEFAVDDPEWQMSMSGAGNPQQARNEILMAALRLGLRQLLPNAGVHVWMAGPIPDPVDEGRGPA